MSHPQTLSRRVGVIGLGAMGAGIAQSLRRAGHEVHAYDIRPGAAAAFAAEGGTACASLADMAAACGIVISVVVNAQQTEAVLYGEGGIAAAMRPGSVFVMCSTVDPNWSVAMEARLNALGLHYVDAPISGGAAKAASGQMTMMTSAKPEAYAAAGVVLDALYTGEAAAGILSWDAEYRPDFHGAMAALKTDYDRDPDAFMAKALERMGASSRSPEP